MTASEQNNGETPRDEVIAAEYVLGVLSSDDRKQVEKRIVADDAFARLVQGWETHFSGLNSAYEPVAPPAAILPQIEKRLFGASNETQSFLPGLWGSLAFWRGMTATITAAAAVILIVTTVNLPQQQTRMSYMAELSSPDVPMAVMVAYNAQSGKMVLTPMASGGTEQKSLELWLVNADGTPRSLGVIDPHKDAEMVVPVEMRDQLRDGMTLAVSLEPYGGSPTGKPTGPVLASGTTRQL